MTTQMLGELVERFVDCIDELHAEVVLKQHEDVARMGTFYAVARLEGASVFMQIAGFSEDLVGMVEDARDRYRGLLDGCPELDAEKAKLDHALAVQRVRQRAAA